MIDILESFSGLIIACWLISLPLVWIFLWIGAPIARIPNLKAGKILAATLITSTLAYAMETLFLLIHAFNTVLGFGLGLLMGLFALQKILRVSLSRAFTAWLFFVAAHVLSVIISTLLFIGNFKDLLTII
jgi:hypothetical protein